MGKDKKIIQSLLDTAGISINGNQEYDIQVHDEAVYGRVIRHGALGIGESYMDGWWDCPRLDQFFHKIFEADLEQQVRGDWNSLVRVVASYVLNPGRKSTAFRVGEKHYDLGNDLFTAMLDKRMTYTCGYWATATDLDAAQEAKLDLVCRKIGLKPGQTVLDIGSGWGSFLGFAAQRYGANTVGMTVSAEQKKLSDELYSQLAATTQLQDYRDIRQTFDHVVSLGMFEHVGRKNYRTFMEVVHGALSDDGLFLLHTIGGNHSTSDVDPWMGKYIFPGGMVPSIKQIGQSIEGLFVMEDWHNLSTDYDTTLMAWHDNFETNWDQIKSNYDERFRRMWNYYLLLSAASFRTRQNQLWQIVLSKHGVPGGYRSVR